MPSVCRRPYATQLRLLALDVRAPLARALMAPAPPPPRVLVVERPAPPPIPHVAILLPLEGRVDVLVRCEEAERSRLFFDLLSDDRKLDLLERAVELAAEATRDPRLVDGRRRRRA